MDLLQRQAAPECFCKLMSVLWRCHGMKPPRERGRPARTKTGTASVISTRETVSLDELVRVARVYALTAVAYC